MNHDDRYHLERLIDDYGVACGMFGPRGEERSYDKIMDKLTQIQEKESHALRNSEGKRDSTKRW